METLQKKLSFNENLLSNVTKRMDQWINNLITREEINEHLLILTTMIADLSNDTKDTMDYLTYTKEGIIL